MKKIIGISLVFLCFLVSHSDNAFCQDTTNTRYESEEADDQNTPIDTGVVAIIVPRTVIGLELGLNASYLTTNINTNAENTGNPVIGGRLGMVLDIPLYKGLYLQPGFFYAMNGGNIIGAETWSVNTIEVPVNFIYKFRMPGANFFFAGFGPYIGYNLSGTANGRSLNIGSDENDDIKALDFGLGINAGYELRNGWYIRVRYQEGFVNLQPESQFATINSSSYGLQVGYFFGRRVKPVLLYQQHPEQRIWE